MTVPEAPPKHTNAIHTPQLPITLFVYGTLKRGYWNHDRFCRNAIDIHPATTWGRLYQLPAGYPALEVPQSHILAHGTADPIADAQTQDRLATRPLTFTRPNGDWDLIQGELMAFPNPARDLPPIDKLEGFDPGGLYLYHRALFPTFAGVGSFPSWIYVKSSLCNDMRICSGKWELLR